MINIIEKKIDPDNDEILKTYFTMDSDFISNYKIINQIQESLCSKIYKVKRMKDNQIFICKVSTNYNKNEYIIPRLINTERIVEILEVYKKHDKLYIIMPYIEPCMDMLDYINKHLLYTEEKLKIWIKEMLLCIKDCHDLNICHLDIKAENFIVVSENPPRLQLIDFEYSSKVGVKSNRVRGTKRYISPEMVRCKYDKGSDIWSLGTFIYFMVYGKRYNHMLDWNKLVNPKNKNLIHFLKNCLHYNIEDRFTVDQLQKHI